VIVGLYTALPAGTYTDYLSGLLGGLPLTVTGATGNNPANSFTMPPHSVSVWQLTASGTPMAGAITPRMGQPGTHVAITGTGFGSTAGAVNLDGTAAGVVSWADDTVVFAVPAMSAASHSIAMTTAAGASVSIPANVTFTVLEAALIPVTFTLQGAPALIGTEQYYLTGNAVELGSNATSFSQSFGPLLIPSVEGSATAIPGASPLITVPMPAGVTVQFKFFKLPTNSTTPSAVGSTYSYTAPTSGVDAKTINW
jgi:hypothetical protein